ncbi:MAG: FHA domain-containing protein [Anaerolineales bacterium]|nr:MAG: FHA domain-containing protein [Anaerolineales bacterium]
MYKYSCRKCPIRNRCIDESANAPTVKEIIRRAFAARTDTFDTWGSLQPNCLLLKAEEERAKAAPQESMLSRRLRQAREAKDKTAEPPTAPPKKQPDYLRPVSPDSPPTQPPPRETHPAMVRRPEAQREGPLRERLPAAEQLSPRWLTLVATGRHITLPSTGELALGRFDPSFGIPPDVDLTYEDEGARTISRRHAKIVGLAGRHTIEDVGSRHGVSINGQRVRSGLPRQLQLGDRVDLGNVQLFYDVVPAQLLDLPLAASFRHFLVVTPTGRKLALAPPDDILIGRSDRYVEFVPDIDLSQEGDVAVRVSRRHAIITWRNRTPHVEDMGSGFGTRLNGETLLIGQAVPLKPGDHIWLGGCVLAYDVEM